MSDLRHKLQEDLLAAAPWDALRDHAANLVIVHGISLIDVGEALATDDVTRVESWLADGTIRRPDQARLDEWDADAPAFVALIVQPWVLIQEPE